MIEAEPSTTHALLVGVEKYAAGNAVINDLDGPANDVYRFANWLHRNSVPAENISVLLSPLDKNANIAKQISDLIGRSPLPATKEEVNKALRECLKAKTASLFFLFWGGHGWIVPQGDRRLLYADAILDDLKNLNLNAQLNAMRTDLYKGVPRQILIVDACANSQKRLANTPPDDLPAIGTHLPSQQQLVLFAANPGEYAINKGDEQTGLFCRELLTELSALPMAGRWPPDMEDVMKRIQRRFIALREQGQTKQTPTYLLYQNWDGNEKLFSQVKSSTHVAGSGVPSVHLKLPRKLSIPEKTELVNLFLECDSVLDYPTRNELVKRLRPQIASKIRRHPAARVDVENLIDTSRSYPGGLTELLEVINFYEQDSTEMQALRAIVAQMLPEEVSE